MAEPEPLPDILIGTSGYDYREWEGVLYLKGIGRKEYLESYKTSARSSSTSAITPMAEKVSGL